MTYHNFDDLMDDLTPEQKARVKTLKDEARAEMVTYTLGELDIGDEDRAVGSDADSRDAETPPEPAQTE